MWISSIPRPLLLYSTAVVAILFAALVIRPFIPLNANVYNSSSPSLNGAFNASYVLLRPNYLPVSHLNPPLRPFYPSIRPPDPDAMGTTEDVELEVINPETCGTIPLDVKNATVAFERTFAEGSSMESKEMEADRPKAAIVYLLDEDWKLPLLSLSLNNLFISFNKRFRYPVFVLHTGMRSDAEVLWCLTSRLPPSSDPKSVVAMVRPITIELSFPGTFAGIRESDPIPPLVEEYPFFQHQSRFWFRQVFLVPEIQNLDYFLRLDSVSRFMRPIGYHIFATMRDHKYEYGYPAYGYRNESAKLRVDHELSSLWSGFVKYKFNWANATGLLEANKNRKLMAVEAATLAPLMYVSNFVLIHVPRFLEEDIVELVGLLTITGKFIEKDGPIHSFCDIDVEIWGSRIARQCCGPTGCPRVKRKGLVGLVKALF
eukprot:TRINITY_DN7243_c0_g1_i3.p1 TRINITY_DN7243_c0_g1~~TRINITY_DN7243_c0_g1_i3.p1  ORF type:complete len:429 (-),score=10.73 TRINITY_DN7243_c0_g1_i3:33-1319(-)